MKHRPTPPAALIDELAHYFNHTTLIRGRQYAAERRVTVLERNDGDGTRHYAGGTVKGSNRYPYAVHVWITVDPTHGKILDIGGECSCPVGDHCKHTVALLITALANDSTVLEGRRVEPNVSDTLAPSPATLTWLSMLDTLGTWVVKSAAGDTPIVYVLDATQNLLTVGKSRRLKNGGLGKPSPWMPYPTDLNPGANNRLQPEDITALKLALGCQETPTTYYQRQLSASLDGETGFLLLCAAARTGRLFIAGDMIQSLHLGEPRTAALEWRHDHAGAQRALFDLPPMIHPLRTWPPAYFDSTTGEVGELKSGLPDDLVRHVLSAPALNDADALIVRNRFIELGRQRGIDLPLPTPRRDLMESPGRPTARLHLRLGRIRHKQMTALDDEIALAELWFDYPDLAPVAAEDNPSPLLRVQRDGATRLLARDLPAEAAFRYRVQAQGLESLARRLPNYVRTDALGACLLPARQDASGWLPFLSVGVAALADADIAVTIAEDFPYQLARADNWFVDVDDESGGDWFTLDLGVNIGDERVSLVRPLMRLIRERPLLLTQINGMTPTDTVPVALDDMRILPIPVARLRAWLLPLLEFLDDDRPRLSRYHAATLAHLEEQPAHWMGGERLRSIGARLKDFAGITAVSPSPTFRAELRPYQLAGLAWLQFLREYHLAGILADDMGLGKTVQTLAHLQLEKLSGRADLPSLVIAPTSLMANWRNEATHFVPELKVLTLHGPDRSERFAEIADADIVLTTYPLLVRDQGILLAQKFHVLVMDEAQFIKNPKAKSHQMARKLVARHRLSLTGTPLENHLGELWAQFDFLMPGFLGTHERFGRVFRTPIEKQGNPLARQTLAERVRPFLMRRTKEQVLTELPPRTEIVRWVDLGGGQRDLYESLRVAFDKKLRQVLREKGVGQSQIMILDALLKLRQVCCDPRLVKLDSAKSVGAKGLEESAKLTLLMEMLDELLDEGRRILLFSQFTSMLELIEKELEKRKIRYTKLTGKTKLREEQIRQFQEGHVPLFLVSLKAGGTGLNLTAADTVIHYDPWWNPAVEEQATARAHRMGQDKPVFVYKLMTQGTVEEKILALQARKKGLTDLLVKGDAGGKHLIGADDLDVLFQPLG